MKWLKVPTIVYQSPPQTLADMDEYFARFIGIEIAREKLVLDGEIGTGEFGMIVSGNLIISEDKKRQIAAKMLRDTENTSNKLKFLQEASIMVQFKHPKIVTLLGIVSKDEPTLIVLEMMDLGNVRNYLKSEPVHGKLRTHELVRMACDVCSAMHYLSESGFIHRDLAARNVLINKDFVCKVSDFGLSQIDEEAHLDLKTEKIPVRWTAPEVCYSLCFV